MTFRLKGWSPFHQEKKKKEKTKKIKLHPDNPIDDAMASWMRGAGMDSTSVATLQAEHDRQLKLGIHKSQRKDD